MTAELVLTPEAEADISDAFLWYEACRKGLGEEFVEQAQTCMLGICRMPEMYSVELQDARRALIHRFPYSIFYRYADGTVMIQAVFHNARDPRKWQARLT